MFSNRLRNAARIVSVSLVSSLLLAAQRTSPTEPTSQEVLAKAADISDLELAGTPGIMLQAEVHLQDGDKGTDGIYAMAWSPSSFRRVFRFPNYVETDVMTNNTIYRQRTTKAMPFLIWELDRLLGFVDIIRQKPSTKPQFTGSSAGSRCIMFPVQLSNWRICTDRSSGDINSMEQYDEIHLLDLHEHFELSDYEQFQNITFPRKLTFSGWDNRRIEVKVKKLLKVTNFPASEFSPISEAEPDHFCKHPDITGKVRPNTGNAIPVGLRNTEVDLYFKISPAGGIRYGEVVYSNNPLKNQEVLNWYLGTHFPIHKCDGQAVGYETIERLMSGRQ